MRRINQFAAVHERREPVPLTPSSSAGVWAGSYCRWRGARLALCTSDDSSRSIAESLEHVKTVGQLSNKVLHSVALGVPRSPAAAA